MVLTGALDVSATGVGSRRRGVGHVIEPIDNGAAQVHGAVIDDDQVNVEVDGPVFDQVQSAVRRY